MISKLTIYRIFLVTICYSLISSTLTLAQEIPGGIDVATDVNLWLRAQDNIVNNADNPAADGEEVKTWTGISNNTFAATKGTNGPLYKADGGADFNNYPTISFDNSDRYLAIPDDDELDGGFGALSIFIVYKAGNTDTRALLMKRDGFLSNQVYGVFYNSGFQTFGYFGNNTAGASGTLTSGNAHVSSFVFNGTLSTTERFQLSLDGGNTVTETSSLTAVPNYNNDLIIGKFGASDTRYLNGDEIAEIFMIKAGLNDAQRIIVENYFEAKYPGITLVNDYFTSNPAGYYHDLVGAGRFNSDEQTSSASSGLVLSFYDGTLDTDGEFVMAAHDNTTNSAVTTNLGAGVEERWARAWYIEKTTAGALNASISFDFSDGIGGQFPQNKSDYVLLRYNSISGNYEDIGIADANKNVSGDRMVFNITDAELIDGIYTLGTTDQTNSPVVGAPNKTWYSYQSGNWNDPTTWTLDGATTPLYVNPGNEIPGSADLVYITNGRTVTIQSTNNNLTVGGIEVIGDLDLTSSSGHSFTTISGDGIIQTQGAAGVDNFPAGDNSGFADKDNGGRLKIYGSGVALNQARSFNNIEIELDNSTDMVTQLADYTVNGEFRIIKGTWLINNNSATTNLDITINGNLEVESLAEINVGTANARHQLNLYGDLDNDGGNVEFTNRIAADYSNEAIDGIVDVNFLADNKDQIVNCKGVTNFYRIEIDKGTDDTYILSLISGSPSFFNLYGPANYGHGSIDQLATNDNAVGLIRGTLQVNDGINIPELSVNGNYNISKGARLWVNGGTVVKDEATAIVPYGTIEISKGYLEATGNSGITFRDNGRIQVDGGTILTNQIRTSIEGANNIGGYVQTGGTVTVNGGLGGVRNTYAVFSLTYEDNVFIMTGGTLNLQGAIDLSDQTTGNSGAFHGGLIFINSDPGNINVTGGTVNITTSENRNHIVTSRAPFYNLSITNSSSGVDAKALITGSTSGDTGLGDNGTNDGGTGDDEWRTLAAQTLTVLNNLTLTTGTARTSGSNTYGTYLDFCSGSTCANLEVGGSLTINDQTVLDLFNGNVDNTGSSSVTFNGSTDATLTIGDVTSYTQGLTGFYDPEDDSFTATTYPPYETWEFPFYNFTVDKPEATLTLNTTGTPGNYGGSTTYSDGAGNKNINGRTSNLIKMANDFTLESGTVDNDVYSIRFMANITNKGTLGVNTTPENALLKLRRENSPSTRVVTTTDGASFGNLRLNSGDLIIQFTSDVIVNRLEYRFGRINIGTHNLQIDTLVYNLANGQVSGGDFGVQDMIIMDGNASDGGLTLYVPSINNPGIADPESGQGSPASATSYLFPIGTGTTNDASSQYTPLIADLQSVTDDGYITVNVVTSELKTTDLTGGDLLNRYWRVRYKDFSTLPELNFLEMGYDDSDIIGTESNYVAGTVLDGGAFTRSYEDESIPENEGVDITNNLITFNGQSDAGFTLENANYTAGVTGRFSGSPDIYYSRAVNGVWWEWQEEDHWSIDQVNKHTGAPISDLGAGSPGVPGAGDIVFVGSDYVNSLTGGTYSDTGNNGRHQIRIDASQGNVEVAEIIFDSFDGASSLIVTDMSRIRVRTGITLTASVIKGTGEMVQDVYVNPTSNGTIVADIGDFARDANNGWFFWLQDNGTIVVDDYDDYPTFRTFGGNGSRYFQFAKDITARNMLIDNNVIFQVAYNLTIDSLVRLGQNQEGIIEFIDTDGISNVDVTLECTDIDMIGGTDSDDNSFRVENAGDNIHKLKVNGDILFTNGSTFDLSSALGSNVILELGGDSGNHSVTDNANITMDVYKIVMNKGLDTTSTFTIPDNFTITQPATSGIQPIEILNGLLILDNTGIDVTLTDASTGDFYLPNTNNTEAASGSGGLEIVQGTVRVTGDDTGIVLDGLLRVNGGTFDMDDTGNNGNNYIEYSASGNAQLEISSGSLVVGSQIRRATSSDAGVLKYTQSGGSVVIGKNAAPESERGIFEVANFGSSFTHTGGDFTIVRQNGTNPAIAALYLQPASHNVSGSTITIGNSDTPTNQDEIGINATIALNNLVVNGENEPTAKIVVNPLTINGDLTIEDDASELGILDANGINLTLNGNFTNNGSYIPNSNTTIFNATTTQLISGTGTSNFFNFSKTNNGTLNLGKDIVIQNILDIDNGVFHTDTYAADVKGNVIHDGLHTSTSGNGIVFSGTAMQQLSRSSIGTSTFGIVTINNTEGVEIPDGNGYSFTINDNLRLQNGVLDIGNSLLTIDTNAEIEEVNTFSITNMIQTNSSFTDFGVMKVFPTIASPTTFTFPVGQAKYTPLTLNITASSAGSITVRPANEIHPSIVEDDEITQSGGADPNIVDADNALQYHWILRASGITGFSGMASFEYDAADAVVTTPYTIANYIPARLLSAGTTWDRAYSQADFDETNLEINFPFSNTNDAGVSGEYTAGVSVDNSDATIFGAIPDEVLEYETNQGGGGDYDVAGTWNTSIPASGPIGSIITVKSGDVLRLNNNDTRLLRTIIETGGVLEIDGTTGHRLGTVEGNGTIKIVSNTVSAVLPAGYYADFFTCGGGSLEYDGTGNYNVLGGITELQNLTFSGSGERKLPNNDLNICNDLTVNNSVQVLDESDRNITIQNDFNINNSSEFVTGSSNINLQGDLTLNTNAVLNAATGNNFTLNGTANQSITGNFSGYALCEFYDLTINKSNGDVFVNDGDTIEVDRNLVLTDGIVTLGNTSILILDTLGVYSGGSENSFVDGYFAVERLSSDFTFPIGDQESYNPLSISSITAGYWETIFRIEDATTNSDIDNLDPDPDLLTTYPSFEVPGYEYWELTGPTPGNAFVQIGWNATTNVTDYTKLFAMQWSDADSHWDMIGDNPSGSNASGTIRSNNSVGFSTQFFTLGQGELVLLPVELVDFSGEFKDDFIRLNWSTSTEQNTAFFVIEKSKDGRNFFEIGEITAVGNSTELSNYSFDDYQPDSGVNYYKLKIMDKDGNFEFSKVIAVRYSFKKQGILAYPNPITDSRVTLLLWGFEGQSNIKIDVIDLLGKLVYTKTLEENVKNNLQVDLTLPGHLKNGLYQLIVNGQRNPFKQKILIK